MRRNKNFIPHLNKKRPFCINHIRKKYIFILLRLSIAMTFSLIILMQGKTLNTVIGYDLTNDTTNKKKNVNKSTFNNQTVTVTRENKGNSFSIQVYKDMDIVSRYIIDGSWEGSRVEELNNYFINYSEKHNLPLSNLTFIDIGANVGWFSFNMAALGVNVLAFEPMEENIALIRNSLALEDNVASGVSGRITLYPHGLGVNDAVCYIYSDKSNVGNGNIKCVENEADVMPEKNHFIRGRTTIHRLDDIVDINDKNLYIPAIKMDTEGYEPHVVEGGSKVLLEGGADAIVSEFVFDYIVGKGNDPVQFIKRMGDAGYHVKRNGKLLSTEEMIEKVKTNKGFGSMDITLERESPIKEDTKPNGEDVNKSIFINDK